MNKKTISQNEIAQLTNNAKANIINKLQNKEETRKLLKQIDSSNLSNEEIINLAITTGCGKGIGAMANALTEYIGSDEIQYYDSFRVVTLRDIADYSNYCDKHREEIIKEKFPLFDELDEESKQMALQIFSLGQDVFASAIYYNMARNAYAVSREYITMNIKDI